MNYLTQCMYDFLVELVGDNADAMGTVARCAEGWTQDECGDLRRSDYHIADLIWCEGYDNIDWSAIEHAFVALLAERAEDADTEPESEADVDSD